jgi:uncharacterized protein YcsI (UPF0317 family)
MLDFFSSPRELRAACARGAFTATTSGHCPGYLQANLVCLPLDAAADFLELCVRNPAPLPLLDVMVAPSPFALRRGRMVTVDADAPQARTRGHAAETAAVEEERDIRRCLPQLRLYTVVAEEHDGGSQRCRGFEMRACDAGVSSADGFGDDARVATFLLGCSFSFERALRDAGVPVRNAEQRRNVSMYVTTRRLEPAGRFVDIPLVVSMRPVPAPLVEAARRVTAALPAAHGAPVYAGNDAGTALGIADLAAVDYGDAVACEPGDVPLFWACGVTAIEAAVRASGAERFFSHAPGCMLVLDVREEAAATMTPEAIEAARRAIADAAGME